MFLTLFLLLFFVSVPVSFADELVNFELADLDVLDETVVAGANVIAGAAFDAV